jgi:hypothetical protein
MSRVALVSPRIEGRICPRTRVDEGERYLGIPPTELFSILQCPGNRVRYMADYVRRPEATGGAPAVGGC